MLDETSSCVCFNLRKTARAITQMYDEILKPSGLRSTQFSVLAVVAAKGPATMTALSKTLVMDRTTLTRNLKPLLDQGLVKAGKGADRRQRPIAITGDGEAALVLALPLWRRAQDRVVVGLGEARWRGMTRLLDEAIGFTE